MNNMIRIFTFVFGAVLAITNPAIAAEPTMADFVKAYKAADQVTKTQFNIHVGGIGDGFSWANTHLEKNRDQKPLYCQPEGLTLRDTNYVDILFDEVSRSKPEFQKFPSGAKGLFLLDGLIRTFPCK
jgi:hypothetical protein